MAGPQVWITAGGARYHESGTCTALLDGQAKAQEQGWSAHNVRAVPLSDLSVRERQPCQSCWPSHAGWTDWTELEHRIYRLADSPYEIDFFNNVIRKIPDLRPASVRVQEPFEFDELKQGRIDFAIVRDGMRIAIEVDGLEKSPTGRPPDADAHDAATRRQNALIEQGWRVLRITNQQVRLKTDWCREQVERCLLETTTTRSDARRYGPSHRRSPPAPRAHAADAAGVADDPTRGNPGSTPDRAVHVRTQPHHRVPWLIAIGCLVLLGLVAATVLVMIDDGGAGPSSTPPTGRTCPAGFPVKGNESRSGERIFHEPGWRYFDSTTPEVCFADADAARAAGFRASKVR
jgi:very-short-patch-repair endonuclease